MGKGAWAGIVAAGLGLGATSARAAPPLQLMPPPPPLPAAAAPSNGTAPAPTDRPGTVVVGDYPLRRLSSGEYTHEHDAWGARIARDGQVKFENHHIKASFRAPLIVDLVKNNASAKDWRYRDPQGRSASDRPDPMIWDRNEKTDPFFRQHLPGNGAGAIIGMLFLPSLVLHVQADLTDELMRLLGQDPYRYEKARFLLTTYDMRIGMAVARQRELLQASIVDLPKRLEALWADEHIVPTEKRAILGRLAEECADDEGGAAARAIIQSFLVKHPPAAR